jgi:cyanophycin synthetase
LLPVKFIVRRVLDEEAPLVLNADDEGIVAFAETLGNRIVWFSLNPENPQLKKTLAKGGLACWLEERWLVMAEGGRRQQIMPVTEIPATVNGMARHNIGNALAAACVAATLGIGASSIRKGLADFRGDEYDNPGRGNWFEHQLDDGTVRILIDFAHNEHGMKALAETISRVPAERVILLMGQAGDRLDQDLADLTAAACMARPDQLLIAELPGYERGRASFEVPQLIRDEAIRVGIPASAIEIFPDPREATAQALRLARPGDFLVLLALTQRTEALALVHEYIGSNKGHG